MKCASCARSIHAVYQQISQIVNNKSVERVLYTMAQRITKKKPKTVRDLRQELLAMSVALVMIYILFNMVALICCTIELTLPKILRDERIHQE